MTRPAYLSSDERAFGRIVLTVRYLVKRRHEMESEILALRSKNISLHRRLAHLESLMGVDRT